MGLLSFFGVMSPAQMIWVRLFGGGRPVGKDTAGNRYYRAAPRPRYKKERRWVVYKGEADASRVPPEWHGWLHHQTDTVPSADEGFRRDWQKPHEPNYTGTNKAYRPPGHVLQGGQRDKATGDYDAWTPDE